MAMRRWNMCLRDSYVKLVREGSDKLDVSTE